MKKTKLTQNTSPRYRKAKKIVLTAITAICMMTAMTTVAFAATGADAFISKAETVLKGVVIAIGGGIGIWGFINLLDAYSNDNPGAKSQGIKQLVGGVGICLCGVALVPVLFNMISGIS